LLACLPQRVRPSTITGRGLHARWDPTRWPGRAEGRGECKKIANTARF